MQKGVSLEYIVIKEEHEMKKKEIKGLAKEILEKELGEYLKNEKLLNDMYTLREFDDYGETNENIIKEDLQTSTLKKMSVKEIKEFFHYFEKKIIKKLTSKKIDKLSYVQIGKLLSLEEGISEKSKLEEKRIKSQRVRKVMKLKEIGEEQIDCTIDFLCVLDGCEEVFEKGK